MLLLVKETLLHWYFSLFKNCINGTKSHKTSLVHHRCLTRPYRGSRSEVFCKVILEISQNSQENTSGSYFGPKYTSAMDTIGCGATFSNFASNITRIQANQLILFYLSRSSHQRCSMKKGVFRNFTKFRGKYLC